MNELYPADATSSQPDVWCDLGGGGGCAAYVNVCPDKGSCLIYVPCVANCTDNNGCFIH
ncbi:MAG: hypothetical protein ACYCYO_10525 [Bacilli bacterium]